MECPGCKEDERPFSNGLCRSCYQERCRLRNNEASDRSRARRYNVSYTLTIGERKEIISKGVCFYCGTTIGSFVLDHYIPLSKGGPTTKENMVCACVRCNASKWTKNPDDFLSYMRDIMAVRPSDEFVGRLRMARGLRFYGISRENY